MKMRKNEYKSRYHLLRCVAFLWALLLLPVTVYGAVLNVTVSTTLLEGIVSQIGGDQVSVTSIIPYAMCPGHFDLSPHTAKAIAGSDLFLQHGFETFTRGLVFDDNGPKRVILGVAGNGMIPAVHRALVTKVTDILCDMKPTAAADFRLNATSYLALIKDAEASVQVGLARLKGVPVLVAAMNADFMEWTGCRVVAVFPRDEALSAKALADLVRAGRQEGVLLIVDNQQSIGRTGRTLSEADGVPLVVLSNFPSLKDGDYTFALKTAVESLTAAVE